jgi:hypothetical protein
MLRSLRKGRKKKDLDPHQNLSFFVSGGRIFPAEDRYLPVAVPHFDGPADRSRQDLVSLDYGRCIVGAFEELGYGGALAIQKAVVVFNIRHWAAPRLVAPRRSDHRSAEPAMNGLDCRFA